MVMVLVSTMAQQKMMSELLRGDSDESSAHKPRPFFDLGVRFSIFGAMLLLALVGKQQVAVFESLLGGMVCLTCSLLLPLVVYVGIFWRGLGRRVRVAHGVAITAAVVLMVVVTVEDIASFVRNWE